MPTEATRIEKPTVAIETHGCKLNQADSSVLAGEFARAGYGVVSGDQPVDVYVVNTCTVTHVADRKARQALRAARRRSPNATIVAAGCYPQRSPQALRGMDEVDLVVGNADKPTLVRQVTDWRGEIPVPCAVGAEPDAVSPKIARTRAMVKIQEGCNQVCAYCIVPKVRGRERSISPDQVVESVNEHVSQGYKEVVLTGTQLGTYGFDLAANSLTRLLERVLAETNVPRLRVSSLQPQEIDDGLLALWWDSRLCPHFHMPLQSGSDEVLGRMRRRYSARQYAATVKTVRALVPAASITADVIVGFPGETEGQFRDTYALCQEIGFAALHVFPYSVRPGTSAAHFGEQVDSVSRSRRAHELIALSKSQSVEFRRRRLGTARPVLWEGRKVVGGEEMWTGLTDSYIRVVARSDRPLANEVTLARLSSQKEDLVVAEVL